MNTHDRLVRLNARLTAVTEFGWIDSTKKLLGGLKARGVTVDRWGSESNYKPFFRKIQVPAARNGGGHSGSPVMDLWHEAGHDMTRNLKSSKYNPIAYKVNPVIAAGRERTANRAASKAIEKLSGDLKMQMDYRGYANKQYQSYRNFPKDIFPASMKRKIPRDGFAL